MSPIWIAFTLLLILLLLYLWPTHPTRNPTSPTPPSSSLPPYPNLEEPLHHQSTWPYPPRNPATNWQTDAELLDEIASNRQRLISRRGIPREDCPYWDPVLQQNTSPPKFGVYVPKYIVDLPCFQQPSLTTPGNSSTTSPPQPAMPESPSLQIQIATHYILTLRSFILPILFVIDAAQHDGHRVLDLCAQLSAHLTNLLPSLRFLAPLFKDNLEGLRGSLDIPAEHLYVLFLWLGAQGTLPCEVMRVLEVIEEVLVLLGGDVRRGAGGPGREVVVAARAAAGQCVGVQMVSGNQEAGAGESGSNKRTAGGMLGNYTVTRDECVGGVDKRERKSKREVKKADTRFRVPKYGEEEDLL
ncbi:uncharacterized protein EI97DRAFT_475159 [Westerdykella ornata]|uniref:Uncharacterized protein n=1 Tax=Westerdykella ornata TaxID=318751 RepID=A0A6A6JH73_WESOR|nr:uncharacterized protein EI97DRAFT_475159 [Westerdykella ornata]KAF2275308.1 hypothetical protein EI97DRAFT_475159 [Westerdykella ornata]